MALTPTQIDALPDYTDAQLLKLTRQQIAEITTSGTSISANGRQLTRADLDNLWQQVRQLETRIADAANGGSPVLLQMNPTSPGIPQ